MSLKLNLGFFYNKVEVKDMQDALSTMVQWYCGVQHYFYDGRLEQFVMVVMVV